MTTEAALPSIPLLPLAARRVRLTCLRDTVLGLFPESQLASLLLSADAEHKRQADSVVIEVPRSLRSRLCAGETFEFALFASAHDAPRLALIEHLLRGLPESAPKYPHAVMFGDNWRLESITDFDSNTGIDNASIAAEVALWAPIRRFRIRLTSPLRIKAGRNDARGRSRYCRTEADIDDAVLNHALTNSLVSLKFALKRDDWQIPKFNLHILRKELFLIDPSQRSGDGVAKPLDEGLLGEIVVEWVDPPSTTQWAHLLLLQYLGVGQARAFGLGRMQLEQMDGAHSKRMLDVEHRAMSLAADDRNLALAYEHVRGNADLSAWPELGDQLPDDEQSEDRAQAKALLDTLARALNDAAVTPSALFPLDVPKPDGGKRQLLIPSFTDRVAQRAVLQAIEPALDAIFSEVSYGFRRGRGCEGARDRIQLLQRRGFSIVAETDVRRFFDDVAWWRIETRLRCLFGADPLVAQIMRWIEAERSDGITRQQGLPQGAALSPILSNLMLDHLDRVLLAAGDQPVRFADDLVILCRDTARAEAALRLTATTLADAGLGLKLEKTRVTDFKQGFRFLGYQFVEGLAVPAQSALAPAASLAPALIEILTPRIETALASEALASSGEEPGTLLVISEPGASLSLEHGKLKLKRRDDAIEHHSFSALSAVLLAARCQLSSEVIKAAMRAGVALHFLTDSGRWLGATSGEPDGDTLALWQTQMQRSQNTEFRLACARELVAARLHSMVVVLTHRRAATATQDAIKQLLDSATRAYTVEALLGIEGQATKRYFAALDELLPFGFEFKSRNRRPPRDPVNALLSFGYTLLYQVAHAVLISAGFNPRIGVYHQARGTHAALASDFIEPYRFIVERQVLSQINRREIKPEDFTTRGDGACLLSSVARRDFVLAMHTRFQQPLRAQNADQAHGLYGHLQLQAESLKHALSSDQTLSAPRFR